MSSIYAVYAQEITAYAQEMSQFGQVCERGINDVLHDKAGPVIADKIDGLMPSSGRRFSGHRSGAKGSPWPVYDRSKNLTIVVSPRASRRYLYFPEDGSSTVNHFGNQQFFRKGNEAAALDVVGMLLERMEKDFKEM